MAIKFDPELLSMMRIFCQYECNQRVDRDKYCEYDEHGVSCPLYQFLLFMENVEDEDLE